MQTKPDDLFRIEIMEDLRGRRSLLLKIALPIILVLPLTLKGVPESLRLAGLPLIALFLGVLGASVGLTRWRERGILPRLAMLPTSRRRMLLQFVAANAAMDGVQMTTPSLVVLASFSPPAGAVLLVAVAMAACVVLSNCVGVLVSVAAGGSGEVHLLSALCVLGIAGISGLFSSSMASAPVIGEVSKALPLGLAADGLSGASFSDSGILALAPILFTILMVVWASLASERLFRSK